MLNYILLTLLLGFFMFKGSLQEVKLYENCNDLAESYCTDFQLNLERTEYYEESSTTPYDYETTTVENGPNEYIPPYSDNGGPPELPPPPPNDKDLPDGHGGGGVGGGGARGPKGEPGPKGEKGDSIIGPPGPPGPAGGPTDGSMYQMIPNGASVAFAGPPGPPGRCECDLTTLLNGTKTIVGPKGEPGIDGRQGDSGLPGIQGTLGAPGQPGPKGDKGDRGEMGVQGPEGTQGMKGEPGKDGDRGLPGAQGPPGPPGNSETQINDTHVPGPGIPGAKGSPGVDGTPGLNGEKGEPGAKGERGLQGERGPTGPKGTSGSAGSKGPKGDVGTPGRDGVPGSPGTPGRGEKGERGEPGGGPGGPAVKGPKGDQGPKGSTGAKGPPGSPGKKGSRGEPGPPGPLGPAGPPGPPGEQGLPGIPGMTAPPSRSQVDGGCNSVCSIVKDSMDSLLTHKPHPPVGTFALVMKEETEEGNEQLLIRVKTGWREVRLGPLIRDDKPHDGGVPPASQPVSPPEELPHQHPQVGSLVSTPHIHLIACNKPYAGDFILSKMDSQCQRDAEKASFRGTFKAFVASPHNNLKSIVSIGHNNSDIPVVNKKDEFLFLSYKDMFYDNSTFLKVPPLLYSFSDHNVMNDNETWPLKYFWHGAAKNGTFSGPLESCDRWNSKQGKGLASSLINSKLLEQNLISCSEKLVVLCVEISEKPHNKISGRRRRRRRRRRSKQSHEGKDKTRLDTVVSDHYVGSDHYAGSDHYEVEDKLDKHHYKVKDIDTLDSEIMKKKKRKYVNGNEEIDEESYADYGLDSKLRRINKEYEDHERTNERGQEGIQSRNKHKNDGEIEGQKKHKRNNKRKDNVEIKDNEQIEIRWKEDRKEEERSKNEERMSDLSEEEKIMGKDWDESEMEWSEED